ncbi:transcriptional regulator with XRE-family HTH domain [Desulfitispora alkaliphila]|uniref:helix-turn-helix domain-containing protein n=1 Tax=Desulfitispora alkaliphila TaxID=622674 RepID=UPI003D252EA9
MSPNQFGDFIAKKRKEKEISLRGMAELLDLSPAYWSDIEKGRRNPPNLNILHELAKVLGLSNGEIDMMVDLASEDRDEIPMDLPDYIKESDLARTALRKARKKSETSGTDATKKAWEDFIKALDDEE